MRVNINLASQPYEVAQTYRHRMTMLITALGVIAALLLGYIVYQRQHSRGINRQLTEVQRQIRGLENEEAQARAILNKPANRVIADQSDFLNQLFARKALSWTRVFTEMEKIVPAGLHVVSMKPELTKTNDLVLHVIVATDSRDRAVEMVRNMEKSAHLRQAQIVAETVTTNSSDQAAGGGTIQFDIAAVYLPGMTDSDEAPQPEAGGKAEATPAGAAVKKAATAKANAPGTSGATPRITMSQSVNAVPNPNAAAANSQGMSTAQRQPVRPYTREH